MLSERKYDRKMFRMAAFGDGKRRRNKHMCVQGGYWIDRVAQRVASWVVRWCSVSTRLQCHMSDCMHARSSMEEGENI